MSISGTCLADTAHGGRETFRNIKPPVYQASEMSLQTPHKMGTLGACLLITLDNLINWSLYQTFRADKSKLGRGARAARKPAAAGLSAKFLKNCSQTSLAAHIISKMAKLSSGEGASAWQTGMEGGEAGQADHASPSRRKSWRQPRQAKTESAGHGG